MRGFLLVTLHARLKRLTLPRSPSYNPVSMKKLLFPALLSLALCAPAFAGTYKLPDKKPVVSVTLPDSWKTDEIDNGVESVSDDEEVYMAIESTSEKNVQKAMEESIQYLKKKGVVVEQDTMKQETMKMNDMDVVDISWDGKDEDGECKISLTVVGVSDTQGLLLTYWASPEGEKKHQSELNDIAKSIKKLGK